MTLNELNDFILINLVSLHGGGGGARAKAPDDTAVQSAEQLTE